MIISKKDLRNIIFLDIETVTQAPSFQDLTCEKQNHWVKKSSQKFCRSEIASTPEMSYKNRGAIFSEFGKIVCISVGTLELEERKSILRVQSYSGSEPEILASFFNLIERWIEKSKKLYLCGHNIREFDIPYICRRAIIQNEQLPKLLRIQGKKPWENKFIIDTLELWRFGDYKNYITLDLLSNCLGIETSKSRMDGSLVHDYYFSGRLSEIIDYCERDVKVVCQIFMKLIQNYKIMDIETIKVQESKFGESQLTTMAI